uniref:Uncharacterized protein n=1 Tax=Sphaerodactylus townsendi TaxID=933632 RepID=A0ACB8FU19_9SAUR
MAAPEAGPVTDQVQLAAGGPLRGPAGKAAGLALESGPGPSPVEQGELALALERVPVEQAELVPVLEQALELELKPAGQARLYSSRSEAQASSDTWSIHQASASDELAPSNRWTANDTFPAKGAVAHIALPKPEG